jgi:hypothetical protein
MAQGFTTDMLAGLVLAAQDTLDWAFKEFQKGTFRTAAAGGNAARH